MKRGVSKELRKALANDHSCYVLITCSEPDTSGQMNVEMNYDGDPTLAAYLLQSAQAYLEDEEDDADCDPLSGDEFRQIN